MNTWSTRVERLKKNTYALYLASRDPRVSVLAKVVVGIVVAYALSPIDLIPDFIPVIGYLDDMVLLPLGIWLALRLIPRDVWADCQKTAAERMSALPGSRGAAAVILSVWVLAAIGLAAWLWPLVR